jgi:serine/threonine-protein kinase
MQSFPTLSTGTCVGHYRIIEHVGAGGMGEVHLAHDPKLDRRVALKFLSQNLCLQPGHRARFERETRAIAKIDHPNIVAVHDVGDYKGRPFLVMQYIEGASLKGLPRGKDLPFERLLDLGAQICDGLQAAHEAGVVHRDIKPSNILVDVHSRARIVDFGLACLAGDEDATRTAGTVGTVGYMSPEQVRGDEVDRRCDLFSLGIVLYELATDHLPFVATSGAAYLHAVIYDDPSPLTEYRDDVPPALCMVIEKALEKDPALRQQTAADLAGDLRRLLGELGETPAVPRRRRSIAVLPFEDMSPHRDQEYFCDGIAEELINALTHVADLRVIARTSAFAFKGRREDVRDIGRTLGVDALLEGSVRQAGRRIRINVQLVSAKDGSHLWSERYERDLEDIFAIQDDVCLSVVERLKVSLLGDERAQLVKRRARDSRSYGQYLKGRFFFNQRKEAGVTKSIECFHKALEIDPRFALAHAGLAVSYEVLGGWRVIPRDVAFGKARQAAMTALEMDDGLSEVHAASAVVKSFCDWDWAGAERDYRRALAINPACAEAHHMYAHCAAFTGRLDSAVAEIKLALDLEPISPGLNSCAAEVFFYARRYEEAVEQCHVTLEIAPSFYGIYGWLAMAHLHGGRAERGMEALEEGLRHLTEDPRLQALAGYAHAMAGRRADAQACLERLAAMSTQRYVDPYFVAWPHAALGDADAAFAWLNKAHDDHSDWLAALKVDPLLDRLRADARFIELLERMRLPI